MQPDGDGVHVRSGPGCGCVHAVHCGMCGATTHRHNAVERALADIRWTNAGIEAKFEQHVPRLDIVRGAGIRKAVMDLMRASSPARATTALLRRGAEPASISATATK